MPPTPAADAVPAKRPVGRPKDPVKRNAILAAARRSFVASGYTGTGMDAVAARAGVSKLTIYSHFSNKDALFQAVIHEMGESLLILRNPEELSGHAPETALYEVARDLLALWLNPETQSLHRMMIVESPQQTRSNRLMVEAGPERFKRQLEGLLRRYETAGLLTFDDVPKAVLHFRALVRGEIYTATLLRLRTRPSHAEMDAHARDVARLFLRAYRP